MNNLLIKLVVNTLSVFITAWIMGNAVHLDGFGTAILVAIVLALLNITIKPLLILFTIPATIFTLGLFLFVINAVVILMVDNLISGFSVDGFWWALVFSFVLSFVNSLLNSLGKEERPQQ